jgi:hypothetical protein
MSDAFMKSERRALKPDAQAFDEVRIVTVPRYKTSGLSGDEWRISASIQFHRKGELIHESDYRNVEMACVFAASEYYRAQDDGKGYFAGQGNTCDQEGCKDPANVVYKLKKEFCRAGHETDPYTAFDSRPLVRKFCDRHSTRGDCGLEDADSNYELIQGGRTTPRPEDVKESILGGVIKIGDSD